MSRERKSARRPKLDVGPSEQELAARGSVRSKVRLTARCQFLFPTLGGHTELLL